MPKSPAEQVAGFLLDFLPGLLPTPADSAVKSAIGVFRGQLDNLLKQPRLRRELLEAARGAETDFWAKAREKLGNDELTQAVASLPLFDRELFQSTLRSLPEHLHEDYLADHLKNYIADDWKGKFTPAELREGAAIYLNCLRLRLLKVEGYADLVTRLAALRTDERTEQILAVVNELLQLVKTLMEQRTPPVSAVSSLFTIPPPVSDFTGREEELETLKASFGNGALITGVSGAGGIGKTELARRLAQEMADDFPHARLQIDLLGTSEHPLTSEEAMRRLLQPFYPDQKPPDSPEQLQGLYRDTFAAHKSLLLLDNAANAAQVRRLIPPAPSAAIVTSRQHFTLTEYGLTPLRLDVLPPAQARQFLRTASPKLKDSPAEEVDKLAARCGRLPLALRVAASLLNDRADWTLATLLARLADERTRLSRLKRDDDRDLDVETAISLSYRLLDDNLKQKFRQLGVFTAPFVKRSAQAVWDLKDETEAEDLLGKLTNRSLLSLSPFGEEFTYALHDLTRLFAVNQLQENGEYDPTALHHADHFLKWAGAADDLYQKGGENILSGLSQFRFIYPHLAAAFDRLSKRGGEPAADRWLSDFPDRCAYVLDLHLPPRQQIPLLELALAASRRLSDKRAEGAHLGNLGRAYAALGEARQAIPFYEQALAIHREIGDRRGEGNDLGNLGLAYADLGDARQAIQFYEQQLVIVREIGDRRGEGNDLGNLGLAYADLGDARQAIPFYEQALAIRREIGDRRGEGADLGNLGNAYAALGDARRAIAFYEQALAIRREIGDRRGEGADLGNLGSAYAALGDARKAIEYYEKALSIMQDSGDRRAEGSILGNLGNACLVLGDARQAIQFYEQALAIHREIGDRRGEGNALGNLGAAYAALGDARQAIPFYEQALAIAREIGDRRGEGAALGNLGLAYAALGDARQAIAYYEKALIIMQDIGDRRAEGSILGNLGLAYADLGDARQAIQFYEQQLVIVREIGDRRGEGNALANLGVAYENLGDKEKARKHWQAALGIFRAIESPHVKTVETWLARLDGDE